MSSAHATDFCERTNQDIAQLLVDPANRIGFKNNGGLFNGGVCWWHSRLQRSSIYLAQFKPEADLPTDSQVEEILTSLRKMDHVVVIPGFKDFQSFSSQYQKQVQKTLDHWQFIDGFINQEWIRGISGKSSLPASEMKAQMDKILDSYLKSPTPIWIMLQIKGITSHALLVMEMKPTDDGYQLSVIDSNHPQDSRTISYHEGDTYLSLGDMDFVPYVGFQNDFKSIFAAIQETCKNTSFNDKSIPMGEIELNTISQ